MQIKKLVLLLALSAIMISSVAQATWKPLFFELRRENQTLYLLGTRHLGVSLREAPPQIISRLRQSEAVYLESNQDGDANFDSQMIASPSLGDVLDLSAIRAVRKKLKWFHISAQEMKLFPTAEVIALLMVPPHQFEKEVGLGMLDYEINQWALQHRKPVHALDKGLAEDPMAALFDLKRARLLLAELIYPGNDFDIQSNDLGDFLKGNLAKFEETLGLIRVSKSELSRLFYYDFLLKRNSHWVKTLDSLKFQKSFVAVGAMHLVGEEGLLKMLSDKGFSVQRLELNIANARCQSLF